ncbi:carboxypeptidase D [[Emmonsia] crescens]|uniref:Carboxypeptidase n=1 Tax=[Emmonsia] crescens TaxID=73230 RepID=A0A0G2J265_9EURO|nr:carboxypeptidase D [Emmonsia crescens UAMH 3008]
MRRYGKFPSLQELVFFLSIGRAVVAAQNLPPTVSAETEGVKTIMSPSGVKIRYKEPGNDGVCETTPGVNSYSGYVDLIEDSHMFFWSFEARHDPANAPVTLFINGGLGSDSAIGFWVNTDLGPCNVTDDLETQLNPVRVPFITYQKHALANAYIGFSYSTTQVGSINVVTGGIEPETFAAVQGRFASHECSHLTTDTSDEAAVTVWNVLQGFYSALPQLDSDIKSRSFNLWTESYGGHYGPSFFKYFRDQNQLIASGTIAGIQVDFNTLGIINGLVDAEIQVRMLRPLTSLNNTYGINPLNQSTVDYMKFSHPRQGGCADSLASCKQMNRTDIIAYATCADALAVCRSTVEGLWYTSAGRGIYDIRQPYDVSPTPPTYFIPYLNQPRVQNALDVNLNYTSAPSAHIFAAFTSTGDWVWPIFLDLPVRVALIYGDADYITNWFGGEVVSLQVVFSQAEQFRRAGYAPFKVRGREYGATREYRNFSFTRMYDAGHKVPCNTNGSEKSTHLQYTPSEDGTASPGTSGSRIARSVIIAGGLAYA